MATTVAASPLVRSRLRTGNRYVSSLTRPRGLIGLGLLSIVVIVGLFGPLVFRVDPTYQFPRPVLGAPSLQHPLGTDELARDLLARLMAGIRVDVLVGVISVPISAALGASVGLLTARGWWIFRLAAQRLFDVINATPVLLLGIGLSAVFGGGVRTLILTVVVAEFPVFARLVRNLVLVQSNREYVWAAEVLGARPRRVLFRHILPNVVDPLVVRLALGISGAVFLEGALSILGAGIQPPAASLGNLLRSSLIYMHTRPTYMLGPLVALAFLVLGLNLVADAINRGADR